MSRTKNLRFFLFAIALPTILLAYACRSQTVVTPVTPAPAEPTPTPVIDRAQLAPDAQQNPFKQFAPGLMARTIYKAEQTGDLEIEIWELLVGPGKKSEPAKLPGAAIAEVRSGTGIVTIGESRRDIAAGAGFPIDDGATFHFENGSQEESLDLRVVVIRSR